MDPERPIEKLLRDYARKRGQEFGAPPEMHPTARRALQDAVARQFRKPRRPLSAWFGGFRGSWPRLAWSLGACAGLALVVLMFLPGIRPQTAKHEMAATRTVFSAAQVVKKEQLEPIARSAQLSLADATQAQTNQVVSASTPLPTALDNEKLRSDAVLPLPQTA